MTRLFLQVIIFLCVVLYIPVLETKLTSWAPNAFYLVALGWFLWAMAYYMRAKLTYITWMLTPSHALLTGVRQWRALTDDEASTVEAPTAPLLHQTTLPPFEYLAPTKDSNKHEQLFWRGRRGGAHLLFLMRLQMLFAAICLAVMYTWLSATPADLNLLILAIFPVLHVMVSFPKV